MNMLKKFKLRILGALVLVPLAIMSGCTGDTNTPSTTGTGNDSVQGAVLDTVSGQGIAGVTVKSGWATVVTDKSGVYNLGSAPYTINSGNLAMPDAAYVVAIDTTTATGAAAAGYGSTYFRRVTVGQTLNSDANILRIGKLNATVKGNVLNANSSFNAGATVTLTYFANGGNASTTTGANNSPVLTASSLSTVTATDGTYSIGKIEAGSQFELTARSADGKFTATAGAYLAGGSTAAASLGSVPAGSSGTLGTTYGTAFAGVTLPPIDNFTFGGTNGNNSTNIVFAAAPDGNQQLVVGAATISVAAGTAATASQGDFTAGTTVITFPFSRAVRATPYTATGGVFQATGTGLPLNPTLINSLLNDVDVNGVAKLGNLTYSVAFATDMKSLTVTFTTSPAYIYTVSINKVLNKIVDENGVAYNNGAAIATTAGVVAFSTSGSPAIAGVPAAPVSVPGLKTGVAGDSTIVIAPVTNAIGAYVYVSKRVNGVVVVDYTAFTNGAAPSTKTPVPFSVPVNLAAVAPGAGNDRFVQGVALGAFQTINAGTSVAAAQPFFGGIDKVDYLVKVVYVTSEKVELTANTVSAIVIEDKTAPQVQGITTAALAVIAPSGAAPATGRAVTSNVVGTTLPNTAVTPNINTVASVAAGGTAALAASFSGDVYADTVPSSGTNNKVFVAKVTFNDQMVKAVVEDGTKWNITDTSNVGAVATTPISYVSGSSTNGGAYAGNCVAVAGFPGVPAAGAPAPLAGTACTASISLNGVPTVTYNTATQEATVTYSLKWTFAQPTIIVPAGGTTYTNNEYAAANAGTGSVYQIGVPNFYFTFAGNDLNSNALIYANTKKGF